VGFDPENNPKLSQMLEALSTNEELKLEETVVDIKSVRILII
jgi:hypothetical protein